MAEIYVDTYAKYNQCRTGGRWVDCDDFYDKESFMEHCREIHSDESDPELMFSDHSDIPSAFISESSVSEALWLWLESSQKDVLVKPRRTLLSENFHTPMDSFHCWLYEAV